MVCSVEPNIGIQSQKIKSRRLKTENEPKLYTKSQTISKIGCFGLFSLFSFENSKPNQTI